MTDPVRIVGELSTTADTAAPGHVVAAHKGPRGHGFACSCGGWTAHARTVEDARRARASLEAHLARVTGTVPPARLGGPTPEETP